MGGNSKGCGRVVNRAPEPSVAAVVWAAVQEAVVRDPRCAPKVPPHPATFDSTILKAPAIVGRPAVDVGRFLSDLPGLELRPSVTGYTGSAPLGMDELDRLMAAYADLPPVEPVRLTQEQWDAAKAAIPEASAWRPPPILGVPVHIVDRLEDSTPYKVWLEKLKAEYAGAMTVPFPEFNLGAEWKP
jgi:hypothetical protein